MKFLFDIKMLDGSHVEMTGYNNHMVLENVWGYDVGGIIIKANHVVEFKDNGYNVDYICYCEELK